MPSNKPAFTAFLADCAHLPICSPRRECLQPSQRIGAPFFQQRRDRWLRSDFGADLRLLGRLSLAPPPQGGTHQPFSLKWVSHGSLWKEKVLFNFPAGYAPESGVIMDASGVLYGVTNGGGQFGSGTVFSLVPQTDGHWNKLTLHSFQRNGTDGSSPVGSLIMDASGNLYGTTFDGGTDGGDAVFELSPQPGGVWTETILHSFAVTTPTGLVAGNLTQAFTTFSMGPPTPARQ